MARWKILRGIHCDKTATLVSVSDEFPLGDPKKAGVDRQSGDGMFYAGDVIETDVDLSRFNVSTEVKFAKLSEEESDGLAGMTVEQLKKLTEDENIEIPAGLKKAQLIEAIRGARKYQAAVA